MRRCNTRYNYLFSLIALAILQSCGPGFKSSEKLKLESLGLDAHISHSAGTSSPAGNTIHFEVSGTGLENATYEWAHQINGNSGLCNDEGNSSLTHYMITCSQTGLLHVIVNITKEGQTTAASADVQIVVATPTPSPSTDKIVDFHIIQGTGTKPWNTQSQPLVLFVDQTLRIINDDSVNHRLHTNGAPFAHGNDILPGQSLTQTITSAYNSDTSGPLYDHNYQNINPKPDVWIYAYNGTTLYTNSCQSCHGTLVNSNRRNRTPQQIKSAINSVSAMATLKGKLTDREISAIAFKLKD